MFYALLGISVLVMLGLIAYIVVAGRRARGEGAAPSEESVSGRPASSNGKQNGGVKASQELVKVERVFPNGVFLLEGGRLAMAASVHPLLNVVGASPDVLAPVWEEWLRLLPEETELQIVDLPVPPNLSDLVDYWGTKYYTWLQQKETGADEQQARQLQFRLDVCTDYLAATAEAGSVPQRGAFVIFARQIPPAGMNALPHHIEQMVLDVTEWTNMAREQGMTMSPLLGPDVVRLLWLAYYPPRYLALPQQLSERAIARMQGEPVKDEFLLSDEQVQRAIDDPQYLKDLLAPDVFIEETSRVSLGGWSIYPYTMRDAKRLPSPSVLIGRQGEFGDRLVLSCHITIPNQADVADRIAKAATAQDALLQLSHRAGKDRVSYRALQEREGKEEGIMVAETQMDRLLLVHWTGGILVADDEDAHAVLRGFEGTLRVAGVHDYLAAYLVAAQGFFSLLPGHPFTMTNTIPRNVFAANMGPWTPVSVTNYRDQAALDELDEVGVTPVKPGAGRYPLLIRRARGADAGTSDAIVGDPGSGKSVYIKTSTARWLARGERVIIIDPKSEFIGFTRQAGGTQISLTAERGFSLFLFPPVPAGKSNTRDLVRMIIEDNIAALLALYELAKGQSATGPERNVLTKAFRGAMGMLNMTDDPASWEGRDLLLSDVYQYLAQDLAHQYPQVVPLVMATLEQYASRDGEYYARYNTPIALDLSNDLTTITLGMAGLQSDPVQRTMVTYFAVRAASLFSVQSFLMGDEEPPRTHVVVDEASNVVTNAAVITAIVRMISLLPAFGISVHLAFQDFKALQRADALADGQQGGTVSSLNTFTGTLPAYVLLRQPPKSAQAAAEALGLRDDETQAIVRQQPGWFLFVVPSKGMALQAYNRVPEPVAPFIRSDRKATRENLRQLEGQA